MNKDQLVSQHLIDNVLFLSIFNTEFLAAIRSAVPLELFSSIAAEKVANVCFSFFDNFGKAPDKHFGEEYTRAIRGLPETERKICIDYAERLQGVKAPTASYILSRIHDFVRGRTLENTAINIALLVKKGKYGAAETLMYNALRSGVGKENVGIDLTREESPWIRWEKQTDPLSSTGWKLIDRRIGGLYRGRVVVVMGKFKGMKSWSLINIGKEALRRGLTVVHISHENSAEEVEQRYYRIIGSLTKSKNGNIKLPSRLWQGGVRTQYELKEKPVFFSSILDAPTVKKVQRTIRRFGGRLFIKKYPMGSASMVDISRYLDYLERFEKTVPDIIINDYADIQAPIDPKKDLRNQINETYIWHKRIADERNASVITASQMVRDAVEKRKTSLTDFAEDIRKVANVDEAYSINQPTKWEKERFARVALLVARESSTVGVDSIFGTNLDAGQVVEWEAEPRDWWDYIDRMGKEEN